MALARSAASALALLPRHDCRLHRRPRKLLARLAVGVRAQRSRAAAAPVAPPLLLQALLTYARRRDASEPREGRLSFLLPTVGLADDRRARSRCVVPWGIGVECLRSLWR